MTCTSGMPPKTLISVEKKAKATAYAAAMAAEGPSLMELMGSVPAPKKHKKRSVSFASQAEVQTLTPEGGHQVLTSAPISPPKHESQSAKPDPKLELKPNPSKASDQPAAAEALPDPQAEVMVEHAEDEGISQTPRKSGHAGSRRLDLPNVLFTRVPHPFYPSYFDAYLKPTNLTTFSIFEGFIGTL